MKEIVLGDKETTLTVTKSEEGCIFTVSGVRGFTMLNHDETDQMYKAIFYSIQTPYLIRCPIKIKDISIHTVNGIVKLALNQYEFKLDKQCSDNLLAILSFDKERTMSEKLTQETRGALERSSAKTLEIINLKKEIAELKNQVQDFKDSEQAELRFIMAPCQHSKSFFKKEWLKCACEFFEPKNPLPERTPKNCYYRSKEYGYCQLPVLYGIDIIHFKKCGKNCCPVHKFKKSYFEFETESKPKDQPNLIWERCGNCDKFLNVENITYREQYNGFCSGLGYGRFTPKNKDSEKCDNHNYQKGKF